MLAVRSIRVESFFVLENARQIIGRLNWKLGVYFVMLRFRFWCVWNAYLLT